MKFALAVCIILVVTGTGFAIKCYVCPNCPTPSSSDLMDCTSASTQCITTTAGGVVARTCGATGSPTGCNTVAGAKACICDGEGCNGANGVHAAALVASVITAVLTLMLM